MTTTEAQPRAGARRDRTAELADRQDIHDCLMRVSRGIDRGDRELFLSAYHGDGMLGLAGHESTPADAYDRTAVHLEKTHQAGLHTLLNHSCELAGDTAHCETYFIFLGRNHDETTRISAGRYVDRMERRDGEWRIARRCTFLECAGVMPPKTTPVLDGLVAAAGAAMKPSRSKEDPSYRRPL